MFAMEGQAREVRELSNLGWERGELVAFEMQPRQVRELSDLGGERRELVRRWKQIRELFRDIRPNLS